MFMHVIIKVNGNLLRRRHRRQYFRSRWLATRNYALVNIACVSRWYKHYQDATLLMVLCTTQDNYLATVTCVRNVTPKTNDSKSATDSSSSLLRFNGLPSQYSSFQSDYQALPHTTSITSSVGMYIPLYYWPISKSFFVMVIPFPNFCMVQVFRK